MLPFARSFQTNGVKRWTQKRTVLDARLFKLSAVHEPSTVNRPTRLYQPSTRLITSSTPPRQQRQAINFAKGNTKRKHHRGPPLPSPPPPKLRLSLPTWSNAASLNPRLLFVHIWSPKPRRAHTRLKQTGLTERARGLNYGTVRQGRVYTIHKKVHRRALKKFCDLIHYFMLRYFVVCIRYDNVFGARGGG